MDNQQQPAAIAGPSHYEQREEVLTKVIASLPDLLDKCEQEVAAAIVASLLKAHQRHGAPDREATDDLDTIINRLKAEEAEEDAGDY